MIGNITNTNKIVIKNNNIVCNLPLKYLTEDIPEYHRKYKIKINENKISSKSIAIKKSVKHVLFKILGNLNFSSKKWIYEQYDSTVMGDTIFTSNTSDASVIKVHGIHKRIISRKRHSIIY